MTRELEFGDGASPDYKKLSNVPLEEGQLLRPWFLGPLGPVVGCHACKRAYGQHRAFVPGGWLFMAFPGKYWHLVLHRPKVWADGGFP